MYNPIFKIMVQKEITADNPDQECKDSGTEKIKLIGFAKIGMMFVILGISKISFLKFIFAII